jgi:TnpA family transposase
VQRAINAAEKGQQEKYFSSRKKRNQAIQSLLQSRLSFKQYWEATKQIVQNPLLSDPEKVDLIGLLMIQEPDTGPESEVELLEKELEYIPDSHFFTSLENGFLKLKNRIGGILSHISFDELTSDQHLLEAIRFYQAGEKLTAKKAPIAFLEAGQQAMLYDLKGEFRPNLYKMFLFIAIADAIKSGQLNVKYSYKYLSIEQYLLPKQLWKQQKEELLERIGLGALSSFPKTIQEWKLSLDQQYIQTNTRIRQQENEHLSFSKDRKPIVETPRVEKMEVDKVADLFADCKYVSILKILSDIQQMTSFLSSFEHFTIKDTKDRPTAETFFAGLIGLGCNIGTDKIGQISKGINTHTLDNTVNWYFSLDNLQAANKRIVEFIDKIPLAGVYKKSKEELHTSSDGQKFSTGIDTLNANYSYKYFGSGKGVSVQSFIDERFALFSSYVISSSEREAAYVIDGLLHNEVIRSTIHSTDTHGFSEIVFAVISLLGMRFAPRIQNFKDQILYSFVTRKEYEDKGYPILPDRYINEELIEQNWDDILRFIATIKLKEVTASQLLKRLSSYSRQHPLYRALKEIGKIHKTHFLLKYMDEVELRQSIEKQLNKIELSHKFAKAIFFGGNQEFKQDTKERQEIVVGCRRLIQNSIILWNYFYLSELAARCESEEKKQDILDIISSGSIITWQHINLHGEYDFLEGIDRNSIPFDLDQILSLKIEIET